jgi:hypothetical protein
MRALLLVASLGFVSVAAIACGSSVESTGMGGAAGSGGAGGTTTTSIPTGTTTTTTTGDACTDYLPPSDLGPEVEIRIANAMAVDLYLGDPNQNCSAVDYFSLSAPSGDPPAMYTGSLEICEQTCGELQSSGCECAADCMATYAVRIVPGGEFVTSWRGYLYNRPEMPLACFHDPVCGPLCALEVAAPASVRITALAYEEVTCSTGTCTCAPDADGSCSFWDGGPVVGGQTVSTNVVWQSGDTTATLTFGP